MLSFTPGSLYHKVGLILLFWGNLFLFIAEWIYFDFSFTYLYHIILHLSVRICVGATGFVRAPWETNFRLDSAILNEDENDNEVYDSSESLMENARDRSPDSKIKELSFLNLLAYIFSQV